MSNSLDESKALLVRRWGELGGYWGINRTMAEIHALLFASAQPLCTDDLINRLSISRGNASMNLRSLVDWGLIRRVHHLGDRKQYFEADADVWHMFKTITRERRRREVEPIIDTIKRCRQMIAASGTGPDPTAQAEAAVFLRRLGELQRFLTTMGTLFELALQFGNDGVEMLLQLVSAATGEANQPPARQRPGSRSQAAGRSRSARRKRPTVRRARRARG